LNTGLQAGLRRLWNATRYSWAGLRATWRNEEAFRQESLLCLCLLPVALWLGKTGLERALLISSLLLIMIVELLNSGIEAVVDRIGSERHRLSGLAKDVGSAAVFMSLLNAALVWLLVLFARWG
jgi:diacylglycerol kinase (ATP)